MSGFWSTKGHARCYTLVNGSIWRGDGQTYATSLAEAQDRGLQAWFENPGAAIKITHQMERTLNSAMLHAAVTQLNPGGGSDEEVPTLPDPGDNPNSLPLIHSDPFDNEANSTYFEKSASNIEWNAGGFLRLTIPNGSVGGGNLHMATGITPSEYLQNGSVGEQDKKYTELEYAYRVRITGATGGFPYKMARTAIFATANWAEAAIAHAWGDPVDGTYIQTDPVRGCVGTQLVTTTYNDFANFHYEGSQNATTNVCDGDWHAVRVYQKLNTPGNADGIQKVWVDGNLEVNDTTINWVDSWVGDYAWNVLFLEAYYNGGAPNEITMDFRDLYIRGTGESVVIAPPEQLVVTTTSVPGAQRTVAYSTTLAAQNGVTPYTWSVLSGSLPTGLSLSGSGVISGTPTTEQTSSFTVRVTDNAANTADQALSITVAAPPSGVQPSQTIDWASYNDAADFFTSGDGQVVSATDGTYVITTVTPPVGESFTKTMRMTFLASQSHSDMGVGFRDAPINGQPRELWIEFYARFQSGFTTSGPESGGTDWKFLFLFDQQHSGSWRWAHHVGVFGNDIQMRLSGATTLQTKASDIFDAGWHKFRYHAKMDATTGKWGWGLDGNAIEYHSQSNTDRGGSYYFNDFSLGRTFNKGVASDQWYEVGPIKIYTTNPGW